MPIEALTMLLPCPFCGETNVDVHEGDTFRWRYAACRSCDARAPEVRIRTTGHGTKPEWEDDARARAITQWNTRIPAKGIT